MKLNREKNDFLSNELKWLLKKLLIIIKDGTDSIKKIITKNDNSLIMLLDVIYSTNTKDERIIGIKK